MRAMILAAGLGTRMQPLTDQQPKPLLRVGDHSLIEHQVLKLARAGVSHIVVNHFYLGAMIEQHLGDGSRYGVALRYSPETVRLETAGGIIKALPLLEDDSFIVVNADIWTDFDYARLLPLANGETRAHLVLVPNAPHHPGGDFHLDAAGSVHQDAQCGDPRYTFAGISVLHRDLFGGQPAVPSRLLPFLQQAMAERRVSGELHQGIWLDIGTPERLEAARRLSSGQYKPTQSR